MRGSRSHRTKRVALTLLIFIMPALALPVSGCVFLPAGSSSGSSGGSGASAGASSGAMSPEESAFAPHLKDLRTCLEPRDSKCPADDVTFSPDDPSISMTAEITNVTPGLQAEVVWSYLGGGDGSVAPFEVARDVVAAEEPRPSRRVVSTIEKKAPEDYWAAGEYRVEIRIAAFQQSQWKTFRVK